MSAEGNKKFSAYFCLFLPAQMNIYQVRLFISTDVYMQVRTNEPKVVVSLIFIFLT